MERDVERKEDGSGNALYTLQRISQGRVAGITGPGFSQTLGYDPLGLRVRRAVTGGPDHRFHLEGEHLEAIYNAAGGLRAKFLRGSVIDEVVNGYYYTGASFEPTNYTYHHDPLQSVVGLSGHAGDVEETLRYGPFGNLLASSGSSSSTLRYTGREHDASSGLYYYRARYYDPEIGRFLSEDPQGFDGGDVDLYTYVGSNPLRFSDPTGLIEQHTQLSGAGRVVRELADIVYLEGSFGIQAGASVQFGPLLRGGAEADFGTQRLGWSNEGFREAYTEGVSFEFAAGIPRTPLGIGVEAGVRSQIGFIPSELHRASYLLDRWGTQEAFLAGQLGPFSGQVGARIATDNTDLLVGGSAAAIVGIEVNVNFSEIFDAGRQAIHYASTEVNSAIRARADDK